MSKSTPFLFLLAVSLLVGCGNSDQSVETNWTTKEGDNLLQEKDTLSRLGNPTEVVAAGDTVIYFADWTLNGLHKYNFHTDALSDGTGLGPAPGEIREESAYFLAHLRNDRTWLHDRKQGRITFYGSSVDAVEDITTSGTMRSLPLRDTLYVAVPRAGGVLAEVRTLRRDPGRTGGARSEVLRTYHSDQAEVFGPIPSNYALKYGPAASCGGSVIIGFEFGSPLLRVRKDTIGLLEGPPEQIEFPDQPDRSKGQAGLPNWFNPIATLDLACDSTRIYALFSGKKVSKSKVRRLSLTGNLTSSKRAELTATTERSRRLHVYDRETGAFVHEVGLPVEARQIAAADGSLYLLTHEKNGPHIRRYAWKNKYPPNASR
jgi:hypothetical protein